MLNRIEQRAASGGAALRFDNAAMPLAQADRQWPTQGQDNVVLPHFEELQAI